MRNQWGLELHFIFITIPFLAITYTCLGARNTTVACVEHERLALLKFKHSVVDDSGMLSSWVGNDCCHWERVVCDGVTGNVESLHLRSEFGLFSSSYLYSDSELSASLGELQYLKYLDFTGNNFQESKGIPEFIGTLKELTYLNLSDSCFSSISSFNIGNLSNLKILDLHSHACPWLEAHDMAWISGLSSLEYLDLSGMNLREAKNLDTVLYMIPSLKVLGLSYCGISNANLGLLRNSSTKLSNLIHLDLSSNLLKGQLPYFFQNMTSLEFLGLAHFPLSLESDFTNLLNMFPSLLELHLSGCNLNETHLSHVLHNFTSLYNIQHLDLSGNMLTGPIPDNLKNLELLLVLDLSFNELTGPIPAFPEKLVELHLSFNYLNGSIPESLRKLKLLQVLDLHRNGLTGSIPTFPEKLVELDLSYNKLIYMPVSIGQLSKLRSLDVSYNSLEGTVSESHFANLSMLDLLNTAFNSRLTFNISHEWLPPFQLTRMYLTSCKIVNGFPQWLQNQRRLHTLDMSDATISGPLPVWLQKMPMISFIDLSYNNLTGPLTNLPARDAVYHNDWESNEMGLYLQNNIFEESIPRSLCNVTNLNALDLSRNKLTGEIPNCFKNLQHLSLLKLNSNGLSGVIPGFIANISRLTTLHLNNNNFWGELPTELWNLSSLYILDLGDNAFSGKIPEWNGEKLKSLWVLRLHNNNFTGVIPQSLCKNIDLQIFDVAHNNLAGTIPPCLGELKFVTNYPREILFEYVYEEGVIQVMKGSALEYTKTLLFVTNIDLSSNKFVGEIPIELTALHALEGLNLSNNHLIGRIPDNIGNMESLFSLDLSGNELNGLIPPSIAALNFLSHLNLSNNNLSGSIPTGNQLQTLIDPSIYSGNRDLCGAPLPKNCSNHENPTATPNTKHETVNAIKVWFYFDITCGFATGFWGVIVVLVLKKHWRHKLFMFTEETINKIHVSVLVRINKMKRG